MDDLPVQAEILLDQCWSTHHKLVRPIRECKKYVAACHLAIANHLVRTISGSWRWDWKRYEAIRANANNPRIVLIALSYCKCLLLSLRHHVQAILEASKLD